MTLNEEAETHKIDRYNFINPPKEKQPNSSGKHGIKYNTIKILSTNENKNRR